MPAKTVRNLFLPMLLLVVCLTTAGAVMAEKLYQWVDADGVITYSPEPPPAGQTDRYQEISKQLKTKEIVSAETTTKQTETPQVEKTPDVSENFVAKKNETKFERRLRLAPEQKPVQTPVRSIAPDKPIDHDRIRTQRKCNDLENRISALESRVSVVENADQLNQAIILLTRYQKSHDRYCTKTTQE